MLSLLPVLLLAACGGGGGGSGGSASGPAAAAAVAITSSNQGAVASDALSTGTNTSLANTGTSVVGVQVDTGAAGPLLLASTARKLVSMLPAGVAQATGASTTQTTQCASGGTLTVSGSVASSTAIAAGDSVSLTANNCKDTLNGAPAILNGSMSIAVTSGSYASGSTIYPQHVTMKLTATSFSLATAGETDNLNGDMTLDLTLNSATSESDSISGTAMTLSTTTASGTSGFSLKNYAESYTLNGNTGTFTVNETVETNNSRLGQVSYTIATITPVVVTSGVYTAGAIKVTGSKSALQVTVTGSNTFQLQLDSNGDGTWDATTTKTLAELQQ
jgi:hypothetical protein